MDECPNCGEPIDEDAQACPHCGSDAETGWKPDADYYGVELPDDDLSPPPGDFREASGPRWEPILGMGLVAASGALFVWAATSAHGAMALPSSILLVLCILVASRWVLKRRD